MNGFDLLFDAIDDFVDLKLRIEREESIFRNSGGWHDENRRQRERIVKRMQQGLKDCLEHSHYTGP